MKLMTKKELFSSLIIYLDLDREALEDIQKKTVDPEEKKQIKQELEQIDEFISNLHHYFIEECKKGE